MVEDTHRTVHAQQAFEFADTFTLKFSIHVYGVVPRRRLKLTEPEVSTDGGRKARQPIVLVAEDEAARPIVMGWLDVPRRFAEVKSYGLLKSSYASRAAAQLDIPEDEYDRAISDLAGFLKIHRFEVTVLEAPPRPSSGLERPPPTELEAVPLVALSAMLVIGILIGFGLGYLVFALHVLGRVGA